jgi:calcineurin-like phosphoesterase family protein
MSGGSIHLFGHVHSPPEMKYFNGGRSLDVGLDGNNLMPYNLDEVVDDLRKRPVKREGHH